MTPWPARVLDRRQLFRTTGLVLAAAAAGLAGGCSDVKKAVRDLPRPQPSERADNADQPLLETARAGQGQVLALCVAVRREHRGLASVLDPMIEHHRVQADALGSETATATPGTSVQVPRKTRRALDLVVEAEHEASGARARDALDAASGDFARLLAAISVSCAQHEVELRDARAGLRKGKSG